MKRILTAISLILFIGCDINSSVPEKDDNIEEYFKATINGIEWQADNQSPEFGKIPYGVIVTNNGQKNLSIGGWNFQSWPYITANSISIYPRPGKTEYELDDDIQNGGWGSFSENDDDARFAGYNIIPEKQSNLVLTERTTERGTKYFEGTFSMTLALDPAYRNNAFSNKNRQYPHTLLITNGAFRFVLEDWRNR